MWRLGHWIVEAIERLQLKVVAGMLFWKHDGVPFGRCCSCSVNNSSASPRRPQNPIWWLCVNMFFLSVLSFNRSPSQRPQLHHPKSCWRRREFCRHLLKPGTFNQQYLCPACEIRHICLLMWKDSRLSALLLLRRSGTGAFLRVRDKWICTRSSIKEHNWACCSLLFT